MRKLKLVHSNLGRRFPLEVPNRWRLKKPVYIPEETIRRATVHPSVLRPYINRPELLAKDYFKLSEVVHIDEMFANRVHYGHKIGTVNENMKWALYGERLGVCIFDLEITKKYLLRALNVTAHMAARGAVILFLTVEPTNKLMVEKMALEAGQYVHIRKFEKGTLLHMKRHAGYQIRKPELMIFLSVMNPGSSNHAGIYEALRIPCPTIGICDSNSNPRFVTYPVPGNDDSPSSVQYFMKLFLEAIKRGTENPMRTSYGKWVW